MKNLLLTLAILTTGCTLETNITPEPYTVIFPIETSEDAAGEVFNIPQTPIVCAVVNALVAVNLRAEPGLDAIIIEWLRHGETVTIRKQIAGWSAVNSRAGEGYVKAEYLTETQCEAKEEQE